MIKSKSLGFVEAPVGVFVYHSHCRNDFKHQFHRNMKIKCVASIYDAYYKVVEISVGRERKRKVIKINQKKKEKNKYTYLVEGKDATLSKSHATTFN